MNYALLTNNKLTGLVILEGIPPLGAQASMPAGFRRKPTDQSKQAWMPALPGIF